MKVETKVGIMFLLAVVLVVFFAFLMGAISPFSNSHELKLLYNFAGGIEVGSPVRVMGIKVGKVKEIKFDPSMKSPEGEETKLMIRVSVSKEAWKTVRKDSKFYINLAGVIGEKFIEVTPGSLEAGSFSSGEFVRGEDPPRIDQLISQGYGLAGKILEMVEENEGSVTNTIKMLDSLVSNFNRTLVLIDKTTKNVRIAKMLKNMEQITTDISKVSHKLGSKETEKTIDLLHTLIWRLEALDKEAIKTFMQDEGITARMAF